MEPCTHPGMKRFFASYAKNGLGRYGPSALPPNYIARYLVHSVASQLKNEMLSDLNQLIEKNSISVQLLFDLLI